MKTRKERNNQVLALIFFIVILIAMAVLIALIPEFITMQKIFYISILGTLIGLLIHTFIKEIR